MTKNNIDDAEQITEALSASGTFLQIATANLLDKAEFDIRWEYPVVVAPFVTNPIDDMKARQMNKPPPLDYLNLLTHARDMQLQEQTAIDIVATRGFKDVTFTLCIEVKKKNPKYVKWVFVKQHEHYEKLKIPIISIHDKGRVLLKVPEVAGILNELFITLSDEFMGRFSSERFPIFDYTRALTRDNKGKLNVAGEFYRAEQTDVDDACRQICKGTYGLLLDKIAEIVSSHEDYPNASNVFIPIVVTNAELLACEYDPDTIDSESGYPTKSPQYTNVESLVYDYSLPSVVRFPLPPDTWKVDIDLRRYLAKWHVYIMTMKGLQDFLKALARYW